MLDKRGNEFKKKKEIYTTTSGQLELSSKKIASSIYSRFFHMFSSILCGGSRSASSIKTPSPGAK